MAFIDQHQIIALERIHGYSLVAHLIFDFMDIEYLDRLARKQSTSILIEQFCLDTCRFKFDEMLAAQALIWSEQENTIHLASATIFFQVELICRILACIKSVFPLPVAHQ